MTEQQCLKALCRIQCGAKKDKKCEDCECFDDKVNIWKCVENTQESLVLRQLIREHFELVEKIKIGELSDGYHTFNELYYHRAILFSVILNVYQSKGWKSKKHHDGTMFDGMFIVGIDTPKGQYSYHYDMNLWSLFDVKELEYAPEWDRHKPSDIDRLLSLNYCQTNQPYKLEDLKVGMWVYDIIWEECFEICEIFPKDNEIHVLIHQNRINVKRYEPINFEEGRFFPPTKAFEYQE